MLLDTVKQSMSPSIHDDSMNCGGEPDASHWISWHENTGECKASHLVSISSTNRRHDTLVQTNNGVVPQRLCNEGSQTKSAAPPQLHARGNANKSVHSLKALMGAD